MSINALPESAPDVHPMRCEHDPTDTLTATILDPLNEHMVISRDSLLSYRNTPGNKFFTRSIISPDARRSSLANFVPTTGYFDPFCGITTS